MQEVAPKTAMEVAPIVSLDDAEVKEVKTLTLISKDKKELKVAQDHALISKLVRTTVEGDPECKEVAIPGTDSKTLELVLSYMTHHEGKEPPIIPKPLKSKEMKDVCSDPWDAKYIDEIAKVRQDLYDLILAANYMDITGLLHLGCAKVASQIKGQPLEKIKEILSEGKKQAPAEAKKSE